MAEYTWPAARHHLGAGRSRTKRSTPAPNAPAKPSTVTTSTRDKMLLARVLGCPHAHCKIKSIDIAAPPKRSRACTSRPSSSRCEKAGDEISLAGRPGGRRGRRDRRGRGRRSGRDQGRLRAARRVRQRRRSGRRRSGQAHQQGRRQGHAEKRARRRRRRRSNSPTKSSPGLFKEAAAVVEGHYGIQAITHMCLEPHGSTCEWKDGKLTAHLSTQNVSGTAGQFAAPLGITADDVTVHCDYIGGGFGSKFAADTWGVLAAKLSKELDRPVKLMLDRDLELKNAGSRPSGFADVKVGADSQGVITVWDSHHWSTGGFAGAPVDQDVVPYVIVPPNYRRRVTDDQNQHRPVAGLASTQPSARPARCRRRPSTTSPPSWAWTATTSSCATWSTCPRSGPDVYAEEMKIAAKLMDWKSQVASARQGPGQGLDRQRLGHGHSHLGRRRRAVELPGQDPSRRRRRSRSLGSQDLGTGTRTVIAHGRWPKRSACRSRPSRSTSAARSIRPAVPRAAASRWPASRESNRRAGAGRAAAAQRAGGQKAGRRAPTTLVAKDGRIQDKNDAQKSLSWKEACSLLGMNAAGGQGQVQPGPKSHAVQLRRGRRADGRSGRGSAKPAS